jgi:hypothetical protein
MSRSAPSPKLCALAQRLIAYEADAACGAEADFAPLTLVADKLRQRLVILAGAAGFHSLLGRALTLAKGRTQGLHAVTIEPNGSLEGLGDLGDQGHAAEAGTMLIAEFLGLLVTFIGESLMLVLLRDAWPDLTILDDGTLKEKRP